MSEEIVKLAAWIESQRVRATPTKQLVGWILRHAKAGGQYGAQVDDWPHDSEVTSENLASMVFIAAETDAGGFKLVQTYALLSTFSDGTSNRRTFRARPDDMGDGSDDVEPSEPPTSQGLLAMTMRHLEVSARINAGMLSDSLRAANMVNDRQANQIAQLSMRAERALQAEEELTIAKIAYERQTQTVINENAWKERLAALATEAAPTLMPMVGGLASSVFSMMGKLVEPSPKALPAGRRKKQKKKRARKKRTT